MAGASIPNLSMLSSVAFSPATRQRQTIHSTSARMEIRDDPFSTGSSSSERVYEPIVLDDIDRLHVSELNLEQFERKRSDSSVHLVIRMQSGEEELARQVLSLGESAGRRMTAYHPHATVDVDVITYSSENVASFMITRDGLDLFKNAMMVLGDAEEKQVLRLLSKRVVLEMRMLFFRVLKARSYMVEISLPGEEKVVETVFL